MRLGIRGVMHTKYNTTKNLVCWGIIVFAVFYATFFLTSPVFAYRFTSTNYIIDASTMNTFGGSGSSSSYQMTSSGGESVVGGMASSSYKMGAGYAAQLSSDDPYLKLTVNPSGLVASYDLDEGIGATIYDSSANANSGTLQSGIGWTAGKIGSAFSLDGTGDARVPDNTVIPTGGNMTVELWANPSELAISKVMISQWAHTGFNSTSAGFAIQTSYTAQDRLRVYIGQSATDPLSNFVESKALSAWQPNTWHHIAFVFDGSLSVLTQRARIYVDGVNQTSYVNGTIGPTLIDSSAPLVIGDIPGLARQFNGKIDHIKIFNRSLSANEVMAEYEAQNVGTPSGLAFTQTLLPNTPQEALFDTAVETTNNGYSLSISQDGNLTNGPYSIPAISSTISSPASWSSGTTKGLGFSLASSSAGAIDSKWSGGTAYAALPNTATTFYTRPGTQTTKDLLNMSLKVDIDPMQASGDYNNTFTITGTMSP